MRDFNFRPVGALAFFSPVAGICAYRCNRRIRTLRLSAHDNRCHKTERHLWRER